VIDIRQTQEYANYLKKEGWIVERIENINYFIKKLPLIGSILKIQRPKEINFKIIEKMCRKYHVFQVILEPKLPTIINSTKYYSLLISHGFKLSKSPYLPSKTLQIDITQPISKITANLKKDARLAIRKNLQFTIYNLQTNKEIKTFREAWKKSVKFTRFVPSLESLINLCNSFSIHHPLILTSHNAGAIFLRTEATAYYWQAFTNKEGRTSLSQYSLVYQGILWAKRTACKVFDFEGIYDPRFPNKSWSGFTHFKKSFGGKEVNFPGCYTKFRFPRF